MRKIAIADDNKLFAAEFAKLLKEAAEFEYELDMYEDGAAVLDALKGGKIFDIVFMDVVLGEDNGIGVAETMKEAAPEIKVVFLSSEREYFMDVYAVEHVYFLTKPIDAEHLKKALRKCCQNSNSIVLNCRNESIVLNTDTLLYAEGFGKSCILHLSDGTERAIATALRDIEEPLKLKGFLRIHQSFIINLKYMDGYAKKKHVLFVKDTELPVSRKYSDYADREITRFLGNIY